MKIKVFLTVIFALFLSSCSAFAVETPFITRVSGIATPGTQPLQTALPTATLKTATPKTLSTETSTITSSAYITAETLTAQPTSKIFWRKSVAVLAYPEGDIKPGEAIHPSVYLINPQMKIHNISTNGHASTPLAWAPGGDKLLFSSLPINDYRFLIYEFDLNSGEVKEVELPITGGTDRGEPDWSPNGEKIAFIQWGASNTYIHLWDIQENKIQILTEGYHPKWIKNGEALAFLKPVYGGNLINGKEVWIGSILYQIQTNGQGLKQISPRLTLSKLSVSPDGNWTVFLEEEDGSAELLKLDGTEVINLGFNYNYLYEPTWFSDGEALLYAEDCALKRYNLETKKSTPISGMPKGYCYLYAAIQP